MKMSAVTSARCASILTAAMWLAGPAPTQAALVTWGSATDITGDSDVSLNGSLVAAFNFGGGDVTVNGVTFTSFVAGSPRVLSMTVGDATLSIFDENSNHTLENFDTSSTSAPFTSLSSDYQTLLGTSTGHVFGDWPQTLSLAGLTIGQTYEFEAWVNDSDISGFSSYDLSIDGGDVYLDPNTARDSTSGEVVAGGLGQFVIGTFVADASSQVLTMERGEVGGGLNGFQLRSVAASVPEPGTLALLGLGFAGLASARRRRQ
jgi:hypothetical protein